MKKTLKLMGASYSWIESVIVGKRGTPFIETLEVDKIVSISTDKVQGRRKTLKINLLPRTVLSTATAIESPTMVLAKRELESWRILQFEPTSLRSPDDITFLENPMISSFGEHLPGTLYRLINNKSLTGDIRVKICNELSELVSDIKKIDVDKDDKRDLLTLTITNTSDIVLPARSLSDGTLRFLALSLINNDPEMKGVFCFEEPENGIHPERIKAIVTLIENIACDNSIACDNDNPLRQVIVNTHSPLVVAEIPADSLLFAEPTFIDEMPCIDFKFLPQTWRTNFQKTKHISKGKLLAYLNPYAENVDSSPTLGKAKKHNRIIDRPDFQQLSLFQE
jgi:predicted ATPase